MTDPQPTSGLHHVTNICTDMAEPEAEPGSTEIDRFDEGHTARHR